MKTKKKQIFIGIIIIFIACCLGVAGTIIYMNSGDRKEIKELLAVGDKYLQEMDYENAIVEYAKALEIDPKNKNALSGIESAAVQYADSLLVSTTEVSLERYYGLREILEKSYQIVEAPSIKEKTEEVDDVIKELEEQEEEIRRAEEEKQKAEEEERRAEEEKRKAEEQKEREEKEKEIKECQQWLLEQIYLEYDSGYCEASFDKENSGKYEYIVTFGSCGLEKVYVAVDKETEKGIVTRHLEEDWQNGGWMERNAQFNHTGREYDLKVTDEVVAQRKRYESYESVAKGKYSEKVVSYINENWQDVLNGNATYSQRLVMQVWGEDFSIWEAWITYEAAGSPYPYYFGVRMDLNAKQAIIEQFSGVDGNIPIPATIDLGSE